MCIRDSLNSAPVGWWKDDEDDDERSQNRCENDGGKAPRTVVTLANESFALHQPGSDEEEEICGDDGTVGSCAGEIEFMEREETDAGPLPTKKRRLSDTASSPGEDSQRTEPFPSVEKEVAAVPFGSPGLSPVPYGLSMVSDVDSAEKETAQHRGVDEEEEDYDAVSEADTRYSGVPATVVTAASEDFVCCKTPCAKKAKGGRAETEGPTGPATTPATEATATDSTTNDDTAESPPAAAPPALSLIHI